MADNFDVFVVTQNVGTLAGTSLFPIFKNITANGEINVLQTYMTPGSVNGTGTWYLVWADPTKGATAQGTIAQYGSAANISTAFLPLVGTMSTYNVPPNKYVSLQYEGTAAQHAIISIAYLKGQ